MASTKGCHVADSLLSLLGWPPIPSCAVHPSCHPGIWPGDRRPKPAPDQGEIRKDRRRPPPAAAPLALELLGALAALGKPPAISPHELSKLRSSSMAPARLQAAQRLRHHLALLLRFAHLLPVTRRSSAWARGRPWSSFGPSGEGHAASRHSRWSQSNRRSAIGESRMPLSAGGRPCGSDQLQEPAIPIELTGALLQGCFWRCWSWRRCPWKPREGFANH